MTDIPGNRSCFDSVSRGRFFSRALKYVCCSSWQDAHAYYYRHFEIEASQPCIVLLRIDTHNILPHIYSPQAAFGRNNYRTPQEPRAPGASTTTTTMPLSPTHHEPSPESHSRSVVLITLTLQTRPLYHAHNRKLALANSEPGQEPSGRSGRETAYLQPLLRGH